MLNSFNFRPSELKLPRNVLFPGKGFIYDYYFDKATFGTWHPWSKNVVEEPIPKDSKVIFIFNILVTTFTPKSMFAVHLGGGNAVLCRVSSTLEEHKCIGGIS